MLDVSSGEDGFPGNWAHRCDTCRISACKLYCHTHSAYLCTDCDKCIHAAKPPSLQHKRVRVCTFCKNAPAAFNCKAHAASLCINCDAEIHSANPLACSHIRDPEPPIGFLYVPSATYTDELLGLTLDIDNEFAVNKANEEIDEDETESWLLLNPKNTESQTRNRLSYGGEVGKYLDLTEHNSCIKNQYQDQYKEQQSYIVPQGDDGSECVVPVQWTEANEQQKLQEQEQNIYWDMNHEASKSGFFCTRSSSQSVHMPSMDSSNVPVATISNISNSYMGPSKGTIDLVTNPPLLMPLQFTLMDREAKVLRYRERRKARKFEKKIRYASRKAYAETRPRVKGRFARRTDVELEVDQMFSIKEYCYGILPSF